MVGKLLGPSAISSATPLSHAEWSRLTRAFESVTVLKIGAVDDGRGSSLANANHGGNDWEESSELHIDDFVKIIWIFSLEERPLGQMVGSLRVLSWSEAP